MARGRHEHETGIWSCISAYCGSHRIWSLGCLSGRGQLLRLLVWEVFILSIHVQDGFDLRYQKGRPESGELSEDEDHYNTGMRDTFTCNNGSNDLFFWEIYQVCLRFSSRDI